MGADPDSVLIRSLTQENSLLDQVENFLDETVFIYPDIHDWFREKIRPGLGGNRVCYAAFQHDRVVGVCIGKLSQKSSKLCSMRVDPLWQGVGIGSALLQNFFRDVSQVPARQIHLTISEEIDAQCGGYFRGLGFERSGQLRHPGRAAGDELVYVRPVF
jgi:ribosomal protein S18 acetylase RimI-like enzyme